MKTLIVTDSQGSPLFFNHLEGNMLCLTLMAINTFLGSNFNKTSIKQVKCRGGTLLVFENLGTLKFVACSSHPSQSSYGLRRFLYKSIQLFTVVLSARTLSDEGRVFSAFHSKNKTMRRVISTLSYLLDTSQSIMLDSCEQLDGTLEGSAMTEELNIALGPFVKPINAVRPVLYGILFVGTRVAWVHATPQQAAYPYRLSSADILSLAIFSNSHFNDNAQAEVLTAERVIPVADYTDHAQVVEEIIQSQSTGFPVDPSSSSSSLTITTTTSSASSFATTSPRPIRLTTSSPIAFSSSPSLSEVDEHIIESMSLTQPSFVPPPEASRFSLDSLTVGLNESPWITDLALPDEGHSSGLDSPAPPSFSRSEHSRTLSEPLMVEPHSFSPTIPSRKISDAPLPLSSTAASPSSARSSSLSLPDSTSPSFSPGSHFHPSSTLPDEVPPSHVPLTPDHPIDPSASPSNEPPSGPPSTDAAPQGSQLDQFRSGVFSRIYFNHTDGQQRLLHVYATQLSDNISFVMLGNDDLNKTNAEVTEIRNLMRSGLRAYFDFFSLKEMHHPSIRPFVHQLPGLVHFIFVDRANNRLVAPVIASLEGRKFAHPPSYTQKMQRLIQHHVWQLCAEAHERLLQGYTTMLTKRQDFQYSYRIWFHDAKGAYLTPSKLDFSKIESKTCSTYYYRSLINQLQDDLKQSSPDSTIRCYELYTLYLSTVSAKTIIGYDNKLSRTFIER